MFDIPWLQILAAAYLVWVVGACGSLLMSRRSPQSTLAWMFAFLALPVVSGLYYLVFGPRRMQRRRRRYGRLRNLVAGGVSNHIRELAGPQRPALTHDQKALAAVGQRLGQGEPTFAVRVEINSGGDSV